MKISSLVFDHGGETILVEVDPTLPKGTIRVPESGWFLRLVDHEVPIAPTREVSAPKRGTKRRRVRRRSTERPTVSLVGAKQGRPGYGRVTHRLLANPSDIEQIRRAVRVKDGALSPLQLNLLGARFPEDGILPLPYNELMKTYGMRKDGIVKELRRSLRALGIRQKYLHKRSRDA